MGLHSSKPVSVPMMSTMESANNGHVSIKTGLCSNGIRLPGLIKHFLLDQVDGPVHVRNLPGEEMAAGCTKGRRPAGRGSFMLWTMLCCETLGPGIHVDVTLTHTTYLKIVLNNPISWKCVSIAQIYVSIWHTVYMQKLTLACIWYTTGRIRVVG